MLILYFFYQSFFHVPDPHLVSVALVAVTYDSYLSCCIVIFTEAYFWSHVYLLPCFCPQSFPWAEIYWQLKKRGLWDHNIWSHLVARKNRVLIWCRLFGLKARNMSLASPRHSGCDLVVFSPKKSANSSFGISKAEIAILFVSSSKYSIF